MESPMTTRSREEGNERFISIAMNNKMCTQTKMRGKSTLKTTRWRLFPGLAGVGGPLGLGQHCAPGRFLLGQALHESVTWPWRSRHPCRSSPCPRRRT